MVQGREGYILYPENYPEHKIRKLHARKPHSVSHHAFMYSNEALALGIQLISKFLKGKLQMHQMSITFHLRLLMRLMC